MKISSVNYNNLSANVLTKKNQVIPSVKPAFSELKSSEKSHNDITSVNNLPSSCVKANFLPSFGRSQKIRKVKLLDLAKKEMVKGTIYSEKMDDLTRFNIEVRGQELGYMYVKFDEAIFPEEDMVLPEPYNDIPEIVYLRTLLGDKYKGVGSALIATAIDYSEKQGKKGCLWLKTKKGYAKSLSPYRSDENPIPFYYKVGFKSLDERTDSYIKSCLKSSNYKKLPEKTVLFLPAKNAQIFKHKILET